MKMRLCGFALSFIMFVSALFGQGRPDTGQLTTHQELYSRFDSSLAVSWSQENGTADIITLGKPRSFAQEPITSAAAFLEEIKELLK